MRADDDGIDPEMGHGAVRSLAPDDDAKGIHRGHDRPGAHRELARIELRKVVHAIDGIYGEALEQSVVDHHLGAAGQLFGGLEDEADGAVELARLGQVLGGAKQHRGVPIVAAGMHLAVVARAVRHLVRLKQGKRVHVGAQADRARRVARAQRADDAGSGEAAVDLDSERFELGGHDAGGPRLLEGELGMGVDILAPRRHFVTLGGYAIADRHCVLPGISMLGSVWAMARGKKPRGSISAQCALRW